MMRRARSASLATGAERKAALNIWKVTPAEADAHAGQFADLAGRPAGRDGPKRLAQIVGYVLKIHSLPVSRALSLISDSAILIALNS